MPAIVSNIYVPANIQPPLIVVTQTAYTTQLLVSQSSGGEILVGDVVPEWIAWASEEIDRRTGLCFGAKDRVDFLDGNGLDTIFTDCYPVKEILNMVVDAAPFPKTKCVTNYRTGAFKLEGGRVWPTGLQNVVIDYIHGYEVIPPIVQKIATLLVLKTAYRAKCGSLADSESLGDFSQVRSFRKLNDELDRAWEALGKKFPISLV